MPYSDEDLEHYQRRRWLKPNAHLYMRPDAERWRDPDRARWG